ncbi:MAG: hypothetical protein ACRDJJ_06375 [Actinomycetota bacterium]
MKSRSCASMVILALAASLLAAPTGHAAPSRKAKSAPQVVGTDKAGDWGCNQDCTLAPLGNPLGQDLVKASIGLANPKTVHFVIGVDSLPPWGGIPEFSRYTWEFSVGGEAMQLSGAFTEYIRGICNPAYNPMICPPPRDPGSAPFFLRVGGCTVGGPCEEVGLLHGKFDPGAGTITVPVPLKLLKAKPGSKIGPGASLFGGTIYAAPAAFVTSTALPADTMTVTKTFVVPKGK